MKCFSKVYTESLCLQLSSELWNSKGLLQPSCEFVLSFSVQTFIFFYNQDIREIPQRTAIPEQDTHTHIHSNVHITAILAHAI